MYTEKKLRKNKLSTLLVAIGLLLVSAALLLAAYNIKRDADAARFSNKALNGLLPLFEKTEISDLPRNGGESGEPYAPLPDYAKNPDMSMPIKTVDGVDYIGVLELPALGLKLPVTKEWSYPLLYIAPCRYFGSAYKKNMIIAAHSYRRHFGKLKNLKAGDAVIFTDIAGNAFSYEVIDNILLGPDEREKLISGDWDLTLFTCTYEGRERVTVRCAER